MNNKNTPAKWPLSKLGLKGNPWHGPVTGGELTLPNATTRPYPQPDDQWPDTACTAHTFAIPDQPAVVRTEEQAAADTAAGLQWRNTALLSGHRFDLYGKPLNGWLYVDPDGARWLVQIEQDLETTQFDFSDPIVLTVTLSRFGQFGAAPESYAYYPSVSSWQPDDNAILWSYNDSISPSPLTSAYLLIESLQPTGNRAAVMVHQSRGPLASSPSRPSDDSAIRYPLGWLELVISGPGSSASVSLSVLRTRAQTLQFTHEPRPEPVLYYTGYKWAGANLSAPPVTIQGLFPTDGNVAQYYDFGDDLVYTIDAVTEFDLQTTIRRKISIWPDGAGGWIDVDYVINVHEQASLPLPEPGPQWGRESSVAVTARCAIEVDNVDVIGINYASSSVATGASLLQNDIPYWDGGVYTMGTEGSRTQTHTLDADSSAIVQTLGKPVGSSIPFELPTASLLPTINVPASTSISSVFSVGFGNFGSLGVFVGPGGETVTFITVARHSTHVIGLAMHRLDPDTLTVAGTQRTYTPAATPSGLRGTAATIPHDDARRYSAWDPHSGAIVWLSDDPVCWV